MKSADQFTEKLRERAALPNKLSGGIIINDFSRALAAIDEFIRRAR